MTKEREEIGLLPAKTGTVFPARIELYVLYIVYVYRTGMRSHSPYCVHVGSRAHSYARLQGGEGVIHCDLTKPPS